MELEDENTQKSKNYVLENTKSQSVSFFKLQYTYCGPKDLAIVICGTLASFGLGIAMPLFAITFGGSINNFGDTSGNNAYMNQMGHMCLQFVYIGLGMFAASFFMIWLWSYNGRKISQAIKKDYFRLLMSQEQGFFEVNPDILKYPTKIQSQIKKIEMGLGEKIGNTIMAFTMALASYITGFTVSWKLALVMCAMVPFIVVGGILFMYLMRYSSTLDSRAYESAGAVAEETINNIKTIASFSHFDFEIKRYKDYTDQSLKSGLRVGLYSGITMAFLFFVVFASYTLAIWYGSILIGNQEYNPVTHAAFKVGDILIVLFTVVFGSFSIGQAAPNITAISQACSEAWEFFELRKRKPMIDLSKSIKKPEKETMTGEITFKNVSFTYPKTPDVKLFDDLSMSIEPNKITAIVGPSGSGKTTIVSLIERLYDAEGGEILIDNHNVKDLDLTYYRSLIGYVPQEPVLFNQSIRENVIFGRENVTNEQIWDALRKAYADEFVKTEDDLDFIVGMKGGKLSGGQKQRIAIARAILTKPKFLILDEATSALDYESEKVVQKALNEVSKGITTIIVAHRLSTILNADKIVVLKNGKIVEEGNHKNLLASNGEYAELIRNQVGEVGFTAPEEEQQEENSSAPEAKNLAMENDKLIDNINKNRVLNSEPKLKRKNSYDLLQEKILEQKKKKEEIEKQAGERSKKLWPILMQHPWIVAGAALFTACTGACWPAYGILLADTIQVLGQPITVVVHEGYMESMYFLALAGGALISYFFQAYLFSAIGEYLTYHLRNATFVKYLTLHIGYYDLPENRPSTLTTKLSAETTQIKGIALTMVGVTVQAISTLLIAIILGFVFDWRITLINIGLLPLIMISSVFHMKLQQGFSDVNEVVDNTAGGIVSESIVNTKTIFCYNMQDKVVNLYNKEILNGEKTINKSSFINGILFGLSQFFMFITYAVIFYAGASFINNNTLTIQNMFRAIFVLLFAGFGLGQSQQYVGDIGKSRAAIVSIFSTIDEKSLIDPMEIKNRIDPPAIRPTFVKGEIEFRNVSFAYPSKPEKTVLKNVSFKIYPGQKAAFVGYSGSGKSTIVQLIERFYDVDNGSILIEGVDVREYDLITLRSFISMVMQEPVLFNRTNSENVRYGKLDATKEEVEQAARQANILDLVQPDRDRNLPSGGQKQKLAIARAIIKNPTILLLDEATSALDSKSEIEVQKTLDSVMDGRTSITIAHKLATVVNSDMIFLMDKGEIKESGTHNELLQLKGRYNTLYNFGNTALNKF